jgi:glycosyltransferase involved in cell wall biosynthesis
MRASFPDSLDCRPGKCDSHRVQSEAMKLALVSAKFPFGGKEPYLHAELRALAPYFERIGVYPTSPSDPEWGFADVAAEVERRGLFAPDTLGDAISALVTRPRASLDAVGALLRGSRRAVRLKNLVVVPLGLSLGFRLRRDGFDHVHSYWLSTPASVAFLAARVAGIPWSSTGHLWDIYEDNALALKLPDARFVRAISARGRRDLLATPGCAEADVRVIHVGVDVPDAPPSADAPLVAADVPFALLCAANLVPKKGHADLLEALAELRDRGVAVRCTIAGDGELRDALHAQARALGLDDVVVFRGHVAHAALLDEMRAGAYDAMVLTSLELPGGLMEGIPVALMEAMALGLPVITTDTGSITELVDDACGRVVDQRNVTAIAAAVAELADDPDLRAELARAAYEKVEGEFNVVRVAAELAAALGAPGA